VVLSSCEPLPEAAAESIGEWLAGLGLSEYAQRFAENGIDLSILPDLTEQDLKELGVLLGHRRKMLRAIAQLDSAALGQTAVKSVLHDKAERRQLTVMFCDLVGSTALSAQLYPEEMREVIAAYQAACSSVTPTYDGLIAKFMGDGILVYFGYPRAHEDDAERAVRVGLAILDVVERLQTRAAMPLQIRIGIATAVVVVGDLIGEGAAQEQAVVGQKLDKLEEMLAMGASRVQAVAPIFAALLSIPFGDRYPPLSLTPAQHRRQILAALLDQLEGLARRKPILCGRPLGRRDLG
jgi:class 3 adenylate cyclase